MFKRCSCAYGVGCEAVKHDCSMCSLRCAVSSQDTLCGLEIEGVSRFLRGYREGDAPPSPPPMSCGQTSREATFRDGARASGTGGSGRRWSSSRHITAPAIARSSSAQVLRAAWKIKVTRKTLECLQQDFAVQVGAGVVMRH